MSSRADERADDAADLRQRAGPDARDHGEHEDREGGHVEQVKVHRGSIGEVPGTRR